ncbi:hypothetical protein GQ53DRAFT_413162 [Thozetella sp. PMI_491]|nr:hypothetical protein GQ53DRAFT_413162 [Thozetella sp. PMI_491]
MIRRLGSGALFALAAAAATPPDSFLPSTNTGPGGRNYKDYPHFRIYDAPNDTVADETIANLEAAYSCFVTDLGWRSTGLSFNQDNDDGPFYKVNVYRVNDIQGAAANTGTESKTGLSFLNVVTKYLLEPTVTVHEFGHALTYAERYWIDQTRTGAWWETIAQFVADTYLTNPLCAPARARYKRSEGNTMIDLKKVLGDSYQVIVDGTRNTGNYYQAWPLFSYMYANPDNVTGLGLTMFPGVWTRYKRNSDETPLHVLDRLIQPGQKIQWVVARYWARMAYVDIGHPKAAAMWASQRKSISYADLDAVGGSSGRYKVKAARQPRYMGANINPLKGTGQVSVNVTASAPFTATLAVKGAGGQVRYVELPQGNGQATVANGEEASLVVVNTPDSLVLFDPFKLTSDLNKGLDYEVRLTGVTI